MLDKAAYVDLMRQVVEEMIPDERPMFDLAAEELAGNLYAVGAPTLSVGRPSDEFQFMETAKGVLEFVTLMVGTFEALRRVYLLIPKKPKALTKEIEDRWLSELSAAGMKSELSQKVVERFHGQIESLIEAEAKKA